MSIKAMMVTGDETEDLIGEVMPQLHEMWLKAGSPKDHIILFNAGSGRAGCIPKDKAANAEAVEHLGQEIVDQINAGPQDGYIHVLADLGHGYLLAQASVTPPDEENGKHAMVYGVH